jgi:hypothetical protein
MVLKEEFRKKSNALMISRKKKINIQYTKFSDRPQNGSTLTKTQASPVRLVKIKYGCCLESKVWFAIYNK